ncbi:unnamed protein product [Trifolium pratense]|uniref:Uncharacterized protein n=1 Tax=Trifolium pratense TaxID=57577 RepID=A0ACB0J725_TRIPR|nr:unnamed protein product [Trifolium pratense]
MSELPKKYDKHGDKKGTSNYDSTNNKVSSSKACNTEDTERQRKQPRSDEECSRHFSLKDQQTKYINQKQHNIPDDANEFVPIRYIPDLKNKHQRDQFDAIKKGMKFTGVVDGSFPGGYFITIGVGNCPTLSGVAMFNSDQPAQTERDVNENVPLIPTKIGLTQENQIEKNNYKPVEFKPVNPTGVPINQTNSLDKGKCISMTGPFLHTNFSPSTLSITPPSDQVVTPTAEQHKRYVQTSEGVSRLNNQITKITTAEQFARVNHLGINSSSLNQNTSQHVMSNNIETRNFLQHQLESQNQVVNTILATNLKDRLMRVPGEKGSSSDQNGNNNVVIKLVDDQPSDHVQPNSSFPTSKISKHMQDNN